jgi:hypothetical protein
VNAPAHKQQSSHRITASALVALGTICAFLAIAGLWINRQVLNTDNWTDTSTQLLQDPAIRTQLSEYLVDQLYANVDVSGEIAAALPPQAKGLAAPVSGAVRNLTENATNRLLQRPRVQSLWANANRAAHKTFLNIVEGGGNGVSTNNGQVTLNLKGILDAVEARAGIGGKLAQKLPPDAAQLTVMKSDQLSTAQDIAKLLRPIAIVLLLLMIAFYAAAIFLARARRRETLRAVGFGLILAGVLALLLRSLGGDAVVNSLAGTDSVKPAVESVWRITTRLLAEAATASILYGVFIVLGATLAGPTRAAVASRRALAPYLSQPGYAWGGAAAIVALLLVWAPTPGLRHFTPAIILIALFALGVEALRRVTAREHPDVGGP